MSIINQKACFQKNGFLVSTKKFCLSTTSLLTEFHSHFTKDSTVPIINIARKFFPILQKLSNSDPLFFDTLKQILGDKIDLIQCQLFPGLPGTSGFSPHQDGYYSDPNDPNGLVSVWIALDDVDVENGALCAWQPMPEEYAIHKPNLGGSGPKHNIPASEIGCTPPAGSLKVVLPVERGQYILLHPKLVHSSFPNVSNRSRRVILLIFTASGTTYNIGRGAKRESLQVLLP